MTFSNPRSPKPRFVSSPQKRKSLVEPKDYGTLKAENSTLTVASRGGGQTQRETAYCSLPPFLCKRKREMQVGTLFGFLRCLRTMDSLLTVCVLDRCSYFDSTVSTPTKIFNKRGFKTYIELNLYLGETTLQNCDVLFILYIIKSLAFSFSHGARGRFGSLGVVLGSFSRPLGVAQNREGIQNSL